MSEMKNTETYHELKNLPELRLRAPATTPSLGKLPPSLPSHTIMSKPTDQAPPTHCLPQSSPSQNLFLGTSRGARGTGTTTPERRGGEGLKRDIGWLGVGTSSSSCLSFFFVSGMVVGRFAVLFFSACSSPVSSFQNSTGPAQNSTRLFMVCVFSCRQHMPPLHGGGRKFLLPSSSSRCFLSSSGRCMHNEVPGLLLPPV